MEKLSKKGDVNLVLTAVTVLFIGAVLLILGLVMLDDLYITTSDDTGSTTNETLTTVTEAGETVDNASLCGFHDFAVTQVNNHTLIITSGNYTINPRLGIIYSTGDSQMNNTNWNVTYTYLWGNSEACLATNETIFGQGKFGDYIDLIVLAIVIVVITSMILVGFNMRKTR